MNIQDMIALGISEHEAHLLKTPLGNLMSDPVAMRMVVTASDNLEQKVREENLEYMKLNPKKGLFDNE